MNNKPTGIKMTPKFDLPIDIADMRGYINSWSQQVARSWKNGYAAGKSDPVAPPSLLVWAGMGGSAIGGDYVASIGANSASFPILVHRGGPLPAYVNSNTRMILVSFSGNTAETLDTADQAKRLGCSLDVLTSGGKIKQWAESEGIKPWLIPGSRPPRAALGDSFCYVLGAFAGRGWIDVSNADAEEAVKILDTKDKALNTTPGSGHELDSLLDTMADRKPMIYGTGRMVVVARRWANQINENSKRPAQWGELPEMNHNEVVAYLEGTGWGDRSSVVILVDPSSPADTLKRVEITKQLGEEAGFRTDIIRPTASNPLAQMLELTSIGDWLSYWLALAEGIDPTPVPTIDKLKAAL